MHPAWRCGNAKSGAFIPIIKHSLKELDNLSINLWRKVVSSGLSAVNDSLSALSPYVLILKHLCIRGRRKAFGRSHSWRLIC